MAARSPRSPSRSHHLARRLPPLAQAAIGLALLLAIFPSTLHLPHIGPGAQAEVAPVPGQQQNPGNLSQLGQGSGNGLGSGGSGVDANGLAVPTSASAAVHGGVNPNGTPQSFSCVGNPPRQTEDPLSPPCVASWSGDNGGTTAPGVTANSVTVILYAWSPDTGINYAAPPDPNDSPLRRDIRDLLRFFQNRFATYGRKIQLVLQRPSGNSPAAQSSDAQQTIEQHPFAVILGEGLGATSDLTSYEAGVARDGIVIFNPPTSSAKVSRSFLQQHLPYVYSFAPDLEADEASTASYICRELVGRDALHAPEATLQTQTRKFALVYDSDTTASSQKSAPVLLSALEQACGLNPETATLVANQDNQAMFRQLQANGVTSIIDMSDDVTDFFGTRGAGLTAIQPPYEPEIVVNSDSALGSLQNFTDNLESNPSYSGAAPYLDGVFGITFGWVVPQYPGEFWSQAVREVDPSSTYDPGPDYYLALMQLFTAIQRAGAHLSASAVQSGLGNFTRSFTQPYGLAGAYNDALSGFMQDQEMHYWDSSQTPPGTSEPGCFIDVANGARYRGNDWPSGDHAHDPGRCNALFDPTSGGSVLGDQP